MRALRRCCRAAGVPQSAASMAVLLRARLKPSVSFVLCTHDPTTSDATKAYAEVCCDAPSREFRDVKGSGGRSPHAAVSRRPPNSLDTLVARTKGYTYDAKVRDSSLVQRPLSVAACQALR